MTQPIVDNVRHNAHDAWAATEDLRAGAKASFLDRLEQVARLARVVRAFGFDDLLMRVGLQRRQSPLVAVGAFSLGALFGAGLTLAVTPVGFDIRAVLGKRFKKASAESRGESAAAETRPSNGAGETTAGQSSS